jgi:hypothetical protein
MAVINPVIQLASMLSVVVAGWLASTVLQGLNAHIAGVAFGRIDTVFTASGICILLAGLYALAASQPTRPSQPTRYRSRSPTPSTLMRRPPPTAVHDPTQT